VSDHDWQPPSSVPGSGADASGSPYGAPTPPPPPYGAPTPPPPPPYGAPTAPGTPPAFGVPGQGWAAPAPTGWTPPPRPGLLPLRPMGFGTLLWAPFRTLRRNPAPVFGTGLVVQLVSALATAVVFVPLFIWLFGRLETASAADLDAIMSGAVGWIVLLSLVPIAISVVASAFLQGVMVVEVASGTLGERLTFAALWRRAAQRIGPLIGWTLLIGGAVVLIVGVVVAVIVAAAFISPEAAIAAVLVAVLLGLGLAVLWAWLGTKLALVPSVIVLERAGIAQAVRRSWKLTDGSFWRTFGLILLVGLIVGTAANIVVQPVSIAGSIVAVIVDPTGTGAALTITIVTTVVTAALSILIGAITAVVQAALIAVIYIDLRMRTEGLDLELERHVEARDAGLAVSDPYVEVPTGGPAPTWS
jgi:membrane-anchored glycerophosphoryl diester phosphodiesterase (GDPDase)